MSKYLVNQRFRLVDINAYLDSGMIYEPEDKYVQTSRSFSAALRSGWVVKISDNDAMKHQLMIDKAMTKTAADVKVLDKSNVDKPKDLPNLINDMSDKDVADEVVGDNTEIMNAREVRRKEILKAARPISKDDDVVVVEQNEEDEVVESNDEIETMTDEIDDAVLEVSEDIAKENSDVASIKKQIKTKIRSKKISK